METGRFSRYVYKNPAKRLLAGFTDAVGAFIGMSRKRTPPGAWLRNIQNRRILIIRLDHIGDVLMSLPAAYALQKALPNSVVELLIDEGLIDLVARFWPRERLVGVRDHWFSRGIAWGAGVRSFFALKPRLKERNYAAAFDLRGDLRHALLMAWSGIPYRAGRGETGGGFLLDLDCAGAWNRHEVLRNLDLIRASGIAADESAIQFEPPAMMMRAHEREGCSYHVVIHAGAGYPSKRWPAEYFDRVVDVLIAKGNVRITLIGTEAEKKEWRLRVPEEGVRDLRGQTRLDQLPELIAGADLFLGNDSGPAHIAAALTVESVILFSGANRPERWRPWNQKAKILTHDVACSPCESSVCRFEHFDCLRKITPERVVREIELRLTEWRAAQKRSVT